MSNRTMLEINHDYAPRNEKEKQYWLQSMMHYLSSGDPLYLPPGVTWFGMRHHSQPCPMGEPPRGWCNNEHQPRPDASTPTEQGGPEQ